MGRCLRCSLGVSEISVVEVGFRGIEKGKGPVGLACCKLESGVGTKRFVRGMESVVAWHLIGVLMAWEKRSNAIRQHK